MSWHFSRALVEEYWQDIDSDGAQFVQSRSSHTQLALCSHDKMTEFSRPSLSGMTFAHLTETLGRELLTWFLEGFPAKTSALLDSEKDSVEEGADSGVKWRELFVRYHPDSSSWKTHQCLWNEVLLESSLTLPKWGMMLDGVLYQLLIPTHITRGRESGYSLQDPPYPTPCASDAKGSGKFPCKAGRDRLDYAIEQGKTKFTTYHHGEEGTGKLNPDWVEWLMGLPVGWTKIDSLSTTCCCFSSLINNFAIP